MAGQTMRAIVYTGVKQVEVRDFPIPKPKTGEVLLRVRACALCTVEQRLYSGVAQRYPTVAGHEYCGEIVEIGEGTKTPLKVGDHASQGSSSCGTCYYCRIGENTRCEQGFGRDKPYEGIPGMWGMAEYKVLPLDRVYKLASDLPYVEGALTEPTACVAHAHRRLNIKMGDNVLVIGAGTMGMLNVLVAKLAGARVMVSELDDARAKKALGLGATDVFNPKDEKFVEKVKAATDGLGPDVVIMAIGNAAANKQAFSVLAPLGRMCFFASAHPAQEFCVDPNQMHSIQYTITGSVSGDVQAFVVATRLLNNRILNVKPLIETTFPIERATEALELASAADRVYRVVITM
jgi:threonine dehydrogenase-like Zn-dependent dehydrogenase